MSDIPEDQEFEAAFREASGANPAPLATESQPDSPPASGAAETEPLEPGATSPLPDPAPVTIDIWSNATDEQRAAFIAAQEDAQKYRHRVASDEGRVARYQRERDEAKKALAALNGVTEREDINAYLASDEWNKSKSEYGDDLAPVFKTMEQLVERNKILESRFAEMDEIQAARHEESQQALLTEMAPDWKELLGREDFPAWLETQPEHVQDGIRINFDRLTDPAQAFDVVERFRASLNGTPPQQTAPQQQLDQKRAAQLDASRAVTSKMPVAAESADDFEAFFQQATAARERRTAHR